MTFYQRVVTTEWKLLLRDRQTVFMLLAFPLILVMLFGFALTNIQKNIPVGIVDYSHSAESRRLIARIDHSPNLAIEMISPVDYEQTFKQDQINTIVCIPKNFSASKVDDVKILITSDASNPALSQMIAGLLKQLISEDQFYHSRFKPLLNTTYLFNPNLNNATALVPGLSALISMIICVMVTSASLVKEKEKGTAKLVTLSGNSMLQFILAKITPYALVALVQLLLLIYTAEAFFGIKLMGNPVVLALETMVFVASSLGIGILIASLAGSQLNALLSALMGMIIPSLLFSDFLFPTDNLPPLLGAVKYVVITKWYYGMLVSTMIKGAPFDQVIPNFLILLAITLATGITGIKIYEKTAPR